MSKPFSFEWPICARCARGVESIKRELDFFSGDIIYTVSCHGQQVVQRVSGLDLHDVDLITTTAHVSESPVSQFPSIIYRRDQ